MLTKGENEIIVMISIPQSKIWFVLAPEVYLIVMIEGEPPISQHPTKHIKFNFS